MQKIISIITVNFNNLIGLTRTVESVIKQTLRSKIDFIVIDGESNDGSKEYLDIISDSLDYFVSEKDLGIYDAMNKGIKQSKGKYILFLNSGDYLINDQVIRNILLYDIWSNFDLILFDCVDSKDNVLKNYGQGLNLKYLSTKTFAHQSTFINRNLFFEFGIYNINYRIISDWVFFSNIFIKTTPKCFYKNIKITKMDDKIGISSNPMSYLMYKNDREKIDKQRLTELRNLLYYFLFKFYYHSLFYKYFRKIKQYV
jgi:glycosyltransferase involved in cell wall biosynthesis